MSQLIESITECYTERANMIRVCSKEKDYSNFGIDDGKPHVHNIHCIQRIDLYELSKKYVAFNYNGDKVCEYPAESVSVFYTLNPKTP